MAKKILLLNGPNLNLLGKREPHLYGTTTLADVERDCAAAASALGAELASFQSNHEGALVDRLHRAREEGVGAVVVNAAAYTHTSVALRDALLAVAVPFVELHVTNTHAREEFRHRSYLSDKAAAVIMGLGVAGYTVAVEHAVKRL